MEIRFDQYSIRSWQEGDVDSLQKHADNRKIWLNLRDIFPHPYSVEDARSWIRFSLSETPERSFAITSNDEAVGGIGLVFGEDVHSHTAELGYWLGEPYWGNGIMSRAVSKFAAFAFQAYSISRIFAEPYLANQASCRVLEKAGFSLEGVMRRNVIKDGRVQDQVLYAILKD